MMMYNSILALGLIPFAAAFHKGFNLAANNQDGSCKSQADWQKDLDTIKSLPGGFTDVRVYASSDCGTLANLVPAAVGSGIQVLVGVWAEDSAHYGAEKQALLDAINQHGTSWISAISVGSEDLYRGDTTADALAQQIYDVRGMMTTVNGGTGIPVGHVDTWNAWTASGNSAAIQASDFIGFDGYPYFQSSTIGADSTNTFQSTLQATKDTVNSVKPGTPIWITETNWPVAGPDYGPAVPSVANAESYWHDVLCPSFPDYDTYAYTLRDFWVAPGAPSFGVVDANYQPIYNLAC